MARHGKPEGWFRKIPVTNQGVFKRAGVPFGFFMHSGFVCFFIGGWFEQPLTAFSLFSAAIYVARQLTEKDERWWDTLTAKMRSWTVRFIKNRGRMFKPFLDT